MAQIWSESFDYYAVATDIATRYPGAGIIVSGSLTANTAFGSGQAYSHASGQTLVLPIPWGSNETTIYGSIRLQWASTGAVAGSYIYVTFQDGSNNQCTIRWNGDGSIGIYSGGPTGTLLQTYTGMFSLNAWDSWQFKVVINNTAGSVELRKDGATTDTISLTGVNTRAGSSNSYANTFTLGGNSAATAAWRLDDFFLCSGSGAAPNGWLGDIRAMQQVPAGQTQAQFSQGGTTSETLGLAGTSGANNNVGANTIYYQGLYTPTRNGTVSGGFIRVNTAFTGHVMVALYDNTGPGGAPGNLVGASSPVTNPVVGANAYSFASPPTVSAGRSYWIAILADTTFSSQVQNTNIPAGSIPGSYANGFPSSMGSNATFATVNGNYTSVDFINAWSNASLVQDSAEDGDTTYIYASAVGQEDVYTLNSVPTTYTVVGVEYYVMWRKADGGARTAQLSVSANGSADTPEISSASLSNSYTYSTKFLAADPTGAAWTPVTTNGAKIGVSITA